MVSRMRSVLLTARNTNRRQTSPDATVRAATAAATGSIRSRTGFESANSLSSPASVQRSILHAVAQLPSVVLFETTALLANLRQSWRILRRADGHRMPAQVCRFSCSACCGIPLYSALLLGCIASCTWSFSGCDIVNSGRTTSCLFVFAASDSLSRFQRGGSTGSGR